MNVQTAAVAVLALLAVSSTAFLADVSTDQERSPVAFEDTLSAGLTGVDVQRAESADYRIPRAQVFFSQYEYVVGYYGIASAVTALEGSGIGSQFGRPIAVHVTDYARAGPYLTGEGYLRVETGPAVTWTRATEAVFVVGSGARTPGGPAVVPFGDRDAAESFAAGTGGEILEWGALRARLAGERPEALAAFRDAATNRSRWAETVLDRRATLRERPVSVVVGEDEPTVATAVARAPPNTTVRIPSGTYRANVTVDRPLTIVGEGNGTVLEGTGNGTVLSVETPESAVTDLRITNGGSENTGTYSGNYTRWDGRTRDVYGASDAGVVLRSADRSLLADLTIETRASGVVAVDSEESVARNLTVEGTERWRDGFMGVLSIGSRMVVEGSTVVGGRDGVYLHDAPGTVVRNSTFRDLRYGIHEMYTGRTLLCGNTATGANVGIIVMTRPAGNVLTGNTVRNNEVGMSVSGSGSFVVANHATDNGVRGIEIGTQRSLYTRNTVLDNGVGFRTGTILPTNSVTENDVVGNSRDVVTGRGPARTFGSGGQGNYWGPVPGRDRDGDGVIDRAYRPTGTVDSRVRASSGVAALAESPTVAAIRRFQRSVPGLRNADVVDPAPLAEPVDPDGLDGANRSVPGRCVP